MSPAGTRIAVMLFREQITEALSSGCADVQAGLCLCYLHATRSDIILTMPICEPGLSHFQMGSIAWVKVFRIIPEFRILRPTFHRKSASES